MKCPSCGSDTYVTRTKEDATTPERTRHCVACGLEFKTLELYKNVVEGQARQSSYFQTMISDEARALARELIANHKGEED